MTGDEPTFEAAERELRAIIERLESGNVGVDEAITLWERGEHLYAVCRTRLEAAEGKVDELSQRVQASEPSE
jgi:exodeoxyribonuclease VII small subunit